MATSAFTTAWGAAVLLLMAITAGCCCQAIPLPGEQQCPTDAPSAVLGLRRRGGSPLPVRARSRVLWAQADGMAVVARGLELRSTWLGGEHGPACGDVIGSSEMVDPTGPISSAFEEPFGTDMPVSEPTTPDEPAAEAPIPPQLNSDTEGPFRDDPIELPFPESSPLPTETDPAPPVSASPAPTTQSAPAPPPIESLPMSNRVEQHVHQSLAF